MKTFIALCLLFVAEAASAGDDFRVKLRIQLVNHDDPSGIEITTIEKGQKTATVRTDQNGEAKLDLDKGKLYEVTIVKQGFIPHMIHNVHSEGNGKFDIVLFKEPRSGAFKISGYLGYNRSFDKVKKMTIPEAYLSTGVKIVTEDELTVEERKDLDNIKRTAKSQVKTQHRLDQLMECKAGYETRISEISTDIVAGKVSEQDGETEKLKYQEKLVKLLKELGQLAY